MKTLFDVINISPSRILNGKKNTNIVVYEEGYYRKDYEVKLEGSNCLFFQKLNIMEYSTGTVHLEYSGKGNLKEYIHLINTLLDIYGHDSEMSFRPKINYNYNNIENGDLDYLWYFNDRNEVLKLKDEESNYFYAVILSFVAGECFLDIMNYQNTNWS